MTQGQHARRANTSRSPLSAYANGRKSPSLETFERLAGEAGFDLKAVPRSISLMCRAAVVVVGHRLPTSLPRLSVVEALVTAAFAVVIELVRSAPGFRQ
ncbi:helix-turn-helix domain-containing protein [Rhodococcus erythropolis]|uniref:helix-turn-helix domain-containing protein n=1 Tax=Rhodococcus erythropolis TaxID=1833 RepID=UPI003D0D8E48